MNKSNLSGNYPLNDLTYDLITVIHEKSKALEAFDAYIGDAGDDEEIRDLLERTRTQDEECIAQLHQCLVRMLKQPDQTNSKHGDSDSKSSDFRSSNRPAAHDTSARSGSSSGSPMRPASVKYSSSPRARL